jgi:hypothetical protein
MMSALQHLLAECPSLIAPEWQSIDTIKMFREVIASGASEEDLNAASEQLSKFENLVRVKSTEPNAHPVLAVIAGAVKNHDIEQYQMGYRTNAKLLSEKESLETRNRFMNSIESVCPQFASALSAGFSNQIWDKRCEQFEQAFYWAQGSQWIAELGDPTFSKKLTADLLTAQTTFEQL